MIMMMMMMMIIIIIIKMGMINNMIGSAMRFLIISSLLSSSS
jgi:hypothetical protein